MDDLTREQVATYADPGKSAVSLIYDLKGNVIGNSQHLARTLLKLMTAIDQYCLKIDAANNELGVALETE